MDSLKRFIGGVDVLTFEFENVDVAVADVAEEMGVPVRPGGWVLQTAQQRMVEKTFLRRAGLPVADFAAITDERRPNRGSFRHRLSRRV